MDAPLSGSINLDLLAQHLLKELQIAQATAEAARDQVIALQGKLDLVAHLKAGLMNTQETSNAATGDTTRLDATPKPPAG